METPRGRLTLMILVDQFPRNLYRHTLQMYDGDKKALEIVEGVTRKHDITGQLISQHSARGVGAIDHYDGTGKRVTRSRPFLFDCRSADSAAAISRAGSD